MRWNKSIDNKPKGNLEYDIDVLCKIETLYNGSTIEEYKVLKWRESLGCFIMWSYNANGDFVSMKYNDPDRTNPILSWVTMWTYFKQPK